MKKKNEENRQAESLEQSLEALFGRESDLTDAELDEELDASGIDAAELQANVHKQLFDYANHHFRTLDRDVPANLEKTLRALRPPSAAEKTRAAVRTVENLVGSFLDTAKTKSAELLSKTLPAQTRHAQFAFRNKKELSAADKDLLKSEQEDVDSSDES
jgi:hypothetical protein